MSEAEAVERKNRRRTGWVDGKRKEKNNNTRCHTTHQMDLNQVLTGVIFVIFLDDHLLIIARSRAT